LWARHLPRSPASNPIKRFQRRFEEDLPKISDKGIAYYHAWAFAATRQLGAAFEAAALNLGWLARENTHGLETAIDSFDRISLSNKTFILKGARSASSRRPFDGERMFGEMAEDWEKGLDALRRVKWSG